MKPKLCIVGCWWLLICCHPCGRKQGEREMEHVERRNEGVCRCMEQVQGKLVHGSNLSSLLYLGQPHFRSGSIVFRSICVGFLFFKNETFQVYTFSHRPAGFDPKRMCWQFDNQQLLHVNSPPFVQREVWVFHSLTFWEITPKCWEISKSSVAACANLVQIHYSISSHNSFAVTFGRQWRLFQAFMSASGNLNSMGGFGPLATVNHSWQLQTLPHSFVLFKNLS